VTGQSAPSLQYRLALRLAALFVAGTLVIVAVLLWRAYDTADTLNDRELAMRAEDLARYLARQPDGTVRLALPGPLQKAYDAAADLDIFAIRGSDGRIIAAQPGAFGPVIERWPAPSDDPGYFHLPGLSGGSQDYYGLGITLDSAAGPVAIWVARASGGSALVHSLLQEFVFDVAWVIPVFMLLALAIAILAIRNALRPIREVSEIAASIGPATTSVRLPEEGLPREVAPLVRAVNRALGRLEQGFAVQRQFTANAAHELRTPLAIITGALETMPATNEAGRLKADVDRMNRLVEQLLSVARLDAIALDVSGDADLTGLARDTVANLAPWALSQGRTIAFAGSERPILVKGDGYAIADALRNLVENAVVHSPPGGEVTVSTGADGSVQVADQGPGVMQEDRAHIFERFWRGRQAPSHGAGLGLSIVAEIMKAHGGSVRVDSGEKGGAVFTLAFPASS
jgi:two-component system, OmpR family, sensor histidine kinase TctE